MTRDDNYRMKAAETVELANRATTSVVKGRLLALAEKWLELAIRADRVEVCGTGRLLQIHPLIRSKLPDHRSDPE